MHSTCQMWVSVMLLICIGLVAAHISRSYKYKQDLHRMQYLNDAVKSLELPAVKVDPCNHTVCRDI